MGKLWVYVGTSENEKGRGIYRFSFDAQTGDAGAVELAAEAARPTFLAVHPSRQFLYAVNGIGEFQGAKTGAVSEYSSLSTNTIPDEVMKQLTDWIVQKLKTPK